MQTKHIKSLAREVAHILILFENWHAASKRLPTPALQYNTLGVLLSAKEIHTYPSLKIFLQILTTGLVTTATYESVRLVL